MSEERVQLPTGECDGKSGEQLQRLGYSGHGGTDGIPLILLEQHASGTGRSERRESSDELHDTTAIIFELRQEAG
jgi:hypothetical protein